MTCPLCGEHTRVLTTDYGFDYSETIRKRVCDACGFRFVTVEKYVKPCKRGKYLKMLKEVKD